MKILLAGSPQISIQTFEKVINNFDVVGIVTQPNRKQGRGLKIFETPVSVLAKKYNIKTFKPEKIIDIYEELKELNYDILLTFAFGQWIPTKVLKLGKFKPINIHGSLLPKYRGAAPIHHAILNGDKEIGITLIEMIKEMDAGDMFFKASQQIDEATTTGQAFEIISNIAYDNIVDWLNKIKNNNVLQIKQPKTFSLSPKIQKSFANLESTLTIKEAIRKIRGLSPFPGAFIIQENKRIKIYDVQLTKDNNLFELKFRDGSLWANDYQKESKKRINLNK